MNLNDFVTGLAPEEKVEFCRRIGTSRAYLSQLGTGHRKAGHDLARRMVEASRGMFPRRRDRWLTLESVRPDIWAKPAA